MNMLARCFIGAVLLLLAYPAVAETRIIGTITAKLDGEPVTWHAIYHEDIANHSGVLHQFGADEGRVSANLGGYESADMTFGKDANGNPTITGGGSMMAINFEFSPKDESLSYRLSVDRDDPATVMYIPVAGDYSTLLSLIDGQLKVDKISIADKTTSFSGTFSGHFVKPDGSEETVSVTDGRFEISEARYLNKRSGQSGSGQEKD